MYAHNTPHTLVKFETMAEVFEISLSKDVFEKAVKNALGRVNTSGICNLSQHQLKALFNFLRGKDSFLFANWSWEIANLPTLTRCCQRTF